MWRDKNPLRGNGQLSRDSSRAPPSFQLEVVVRLDLGATRIPWTRAREESPASKCVQSKAPIFQRAVTRPRGYARQESPGKAREESLARAVLNAADTADGARRIPRNAAPAASSWAHCLEGFLSRERRQNRSAGLWSRARFSTRDFIRALFTRPRHQLRRTQRHEVSLEHRMTVENARCGAWLSAQSASGSGTGRSSPAQARSAGPA